MKIQSIATEVATVAAPVGNYSDNFKATANVALDSREVPVLTACDSSFVKGFAYVGTRQVLVVLTVKGAVYEYPKVTKEAFTAFENAESKGHFFNQHFRAIKATKIAENYVA